MTLLTAFSAPVPRNTLSLHQAEFVQNMGQWPSNILFRARLHGGTFFCEPDGFTIALIDPTQLAAFTETKLDCHIPAQSLMDAAAYRQTFLNVNPRAVVSGHDKFPLFHNYFFGQDSSRWRGHVPLFHAVHYHNLYEGIDMEVLQSGRNLEYRYNVAPHADPMLINWQYEGVKSVSVVNECLMLCVGTMRVLELKPFAYQIDNFGDTLTVDCRFVVKGDRVTFKLGDYDVTRPLIIDPTLIFSSYTGSTADNWGYTATYDGDGNLYSGGIAFGVGYPTTLGAYQVDYCGSAFGLNCDVVISKFDSSGSFLHYSTYLGGSRVDIPHSLFVNNNNELYVFGTTGSSDFPVTANAFDTSFNGGMPVMLSTNLIFQHGSDAFVSKFSIDGTQLLSSTFMGGTGNDGINTALELRKNYADDNRGEILIDENSNVYVITSTQSVDFPTTPGAYCTQAALLQNACVFKLSQDLSQMVWGTYFGGDGADAGYGMTLCADGSLYICGGTNSSDLPVSASAYQTSFSGAVDGFVAHFSINGDKLLACTYLGDSTYDQAYLIKNDRLNYPHIFGQTASTGMHWIVNAPYNVPGGGQFLTKLSPALDSVVWSTAFGTGRGGPDISPTALLVDYCNNIYMSGWGSRSLNGFGGTDGLPITSDAFQTTTDGSDFYFVCISDDVSQLVFATYFGGAAMYAREHVDGGTSRFDRKGKIYQAICAGCGGQSSFPTTPNAWSTTNESFNCNLAAVKIDFGMPIVVADFSIPNILCAPWDLPLEIVNHSQIIDTATTSYFWDFGDGTTSTLPEPTHFYTQSGIYQITLVVSDNGSCNFKDSLTKSLLVLSNTVDTLPTLSLCYGDFVQIGVTPDVNASYRWLPDSTLSNMYISNPTVSPLQSTTYTLTVNISGCTDTLIQRVEVYYLRVTASADTTVCLGDTVCLHAFPDSASSYSLIEWSQTPYFDATFGINQWDIRVSPMTTTTYYVRISGYGCTSTDTVTVYIDKITISDLPDIILCFEDSAQLSVVHDGGENCYYHWSVPGAGEYYVANPYVSPSSSTTYSVTVTNSTGCTASTTGRLVRQISTFPTPLTAWCEVCSIWPGSSTMISATDYGENYTYNWMPTTCVDNPDAPKTRVSPRHSTLYTIAVTDTFGCTMTAEVYVNVKNVTCGEPFVYIPNAFSPNGDGKNDILYVRGDILTDLYFAIYNRWGERVFETTQLSVGWDGTYKGKRCQQGVYDYYFRGTCLDEEHVEMKGNITLIR